MMNKTFRGKGLEIWEEKLMQKEEVYSGECDYVLTNYTVHTKNGYITIENPFMVLDAQAFGDNGQKYLRFVLDDKKPFDIIDIPKDNISYVRTKEIRIIDGYERWKELNNI